jgi:hypothetical protein
MIVIRAAAVQLSPVLYSREKTVEKIVGKIAELGRQKVQFATFPEAIVRTKLPREASTPRRSAAGYPSAGPHRCRDPRPGRTAGQRCVPARATAPQPRRLHSWRRPLLLGGKARRIRIARHRVVARDQQLGVTARAHL